MTLIRPTVLVPSCTSVSGAVPPLGVAYLAGALRAGGHDVTCIDAAGEGIGRLNVCEADPSLFEQGLGVPEVIDRIPPETEVIGISCMFSFEWFNVARLIRGIRARFPTQFLVLGGEHASADHEFILRTTPGVDACVIGEGEHKLLALLDALKSGVAKPELPGVAVLDPASGTIRKNAEKDGQYRILDIDSLPRPAWDLLPISAYLDAKVGHGSLRFRAMPMLASRGCPHRCTFCSSPQMWTTRWKARDVEDVIDEIKGYIRKYGINQVLFYDLTMVIDKKWLERFCERLIEEKLPVEWAMPSGSRTEGLTQELMGLIKRSGCERLIYPLETGSPDVSLRIKKKINYARSLSSMRSAVKAGIFTRTHIVFGFPFQTFRDFLVEYLFMFRLVWIGCHDVIFHTFAPYPGSELHDELVAEGKIVKDENYPALLRSVLTSNYSDGRSWNPRFSARGLRLLGMLGMAEFYVLQFLLRPHRLIGLVYRLFAGRPTTWPEMLLSSTVPRQLRRIRFWSPLPNQSRSW